MNGGWQSIAAGEPAPASEEHWSKCLAALLNEALEFLDSLIDIARAIEADESRDAICDQWVFRLNRYYPPHEFDRLIAEIATDIGRDHVDPTQLRKRFYDKWAAEMSLLGSGFDFETEARKRIENVLLSSPILPITGRDIIQAFGIGPGPDVGRLLERAQSLYAAQPCNGDALIDRLKRRR